MSILFVLQTGIVSVCVFILWFNFYFWVNLKLPITWPIQILTKDHHDPEGGLLKSHFTDGRWFLSDRGIRFVCSNKHLWGLPTTPWEFWGHTGLTFSLPNARICEIPLPNNDFQKYHRPNRIPHPSVKWWGSFTVSHDPQFSTSYLRPHQRL